MSKPIHIYLNKKCKYGVKVKIQTGNVTTSSEFDTIKDAAKYLKKQDREYDYAMRIKKEHPFDEV